MKPDTKWLALGRLFSRRRGDNPPVTGVSTHHPRVLEVRFGGWAPITRRVFARKVAAHSPVNCASRLTCEPRTLDRYPASRQDVVPKTRMPYVGFKDDAQYADMLVYLPTLG